MIVGAGGRRFSTEHQNGYGEKVFGPDGPILEFARALEISVHTLRNWEQGRRQPEGPAIALLKIAARHPNIIRRAAARSPSQAKATGR